MGSCSRLARRRPTMSTTPQGPLAQVARVFIPLQIFACLVLGVALQVLGAMDHKDALFILGYDGTGLDPLQQPEAGMAILYGAALLGVFVFMVYARRLKARMPAGAFKP